MSQGSPAARSSGPVMPSERHPSTPIQPTFFSRLTQIGWPRSRRSTPRSSSRWPLMKSRIFSS